MKTSVFGFVCLLAGICPAVPQISGVTVHQRWPWSAKVDVIYDLSGADRPVDIAVTATAGGVPVAVPPSSLEGDWLSVESGTHTLTWDPSAAGLGPDVKELKGLCFTLTPITERRYKIVDLTSGLEKTMAARVSYTNEVIGTGKDAAGNRAWDDLYKTDRLVLRRIPAGTFRMGSGPGDMYRGDEEKYRQVCIQRPFYIGVFEVTQAQGAHFGVVADWVLFTNETYRAMRPVDHILYVNLVGGNHLTDVRYPNAEGTSVIGKLRALVGGGVRFHLPTEAQWEYAARAGSKGVVPGVDDETYTYASEQAAVTAAGNTRQTVLYTTKTNITPDEGGTKPVGTYAPNAWGLYDVIGNVQEWTHDYYATTGYGDGKTYLVDPSPTAEQSVQSWAGTGKIAFVSRGGSYCNNANDPNYYAMRYCRLPARRPGRSYCSDLEGIGFRVFAPIPEE